MGWETTKLGRYEKAFSMPHHFLWDTAEKRVQWHKSSPGWASPGMQGEAS